MPLNLFALTSNPENRIVRFALSQEVQDELTQYITSQEQDFRASIEQEIPFDGKYKPDFGEALVIQNYDDIDGLDQAVKNPLSVADVEPSATTFESIKALFTGHVAQNDKVTILIQHFDKRKIISTNGLSIFHSANVYKKIDGIGVTIDSKLSAILEDGNLKFFSFHLLRQVFDLSEYYKEATDNDIKDFASNPLIKVENLDQLVELSDSWIRRKVSLIQQSQILESVPINDFKAVASEFNIPLDTVIDGGSEVIKLPTNKASLKTILRFLDEDYYKSPLSKVQYITNSKRRA
jgi:hypothetical protein